MDNFDFDLIVAGAGAAGFFGALTAAEYAPGLRILILDKSNHLLSKVLVSGGGRCNVTHNLVDKKMFSRQYPRGEKHVFRLLHQFGYEDTINWFQKRGVELKTEPDGRMFPVTDSSHTIANCLMEEAQKSGIKISTGEGINDIKPLENSGFIIQTNRQQLKTKKLLIATGGHPKKEGFQWLEKLGLGIEKPVPSLFTFNIQNHPLKDLMGLSIISRIRIPEAKIEETGPLLITHWGFSGPAVLRCSAWGARDLANLDYRFSLRLHWLPELDQDEIRDWFQKQRNSNGKSKVKNRLFDGIPQRLWEQLCLRAGIGNEKIWAELSGKEINQLAETISSDSYSVRGKTTFKEEFVTCGGVSLKEIDSHIGMSKKYPGLYFAGEVLDVDGITGGFNFQHAWSSGYVAGKNSASQLKFPD